MEVVYNVKYKFKDNEQKSDDFKYLFNKKLFNVIMKLEREKGIN